MTLRRRPNHTAAHPGERAQGQARRHDGDSASVPPVMTSATGPTTETLQVAGLALRFASGGEGPVALVLHHSFGPSGWTPFHDALSDRFRVIAPDLPGFGESERPDWARDPRDLAVILLQAIERLDLRDVALVGLGFGGYVAAEMAAMNRSRLASLVLIGAAGIQPETGEILDQMLMDYGEYVEAGFADPEAFRVHFGDPPSSGQVEQWTLSREMTARVSWRPYMFDHRLPHVLAEVDTPALLVWGADDAVVPVSAAHGYAAALPNARLETLPGGGHLIDLEQPGRLADLLAEHVTTIEQSRTE